MIFIIMKLVLKNSNKLFDTTQNEVVKEFVKFIRKQLPLQKDTTVTFLEKRDHSMTTGVRRPNSEIFVLTSKRLLIDVLRTLAHEWVHEYQHQKMGLKDDQPVQDIGGKVENMANALGGIMVKKFEKEFPKYENALYGEHES
jgi:hypothetical protein